MHQLPQKLETTWRFSFFFGRVSSSVEDVACLKGLDGSRTKRGSCVDWSKLPGGKVILK